MSRFIMKIFVLFLAINLWNIGFFGPLASDFGGEVTIAKARHIPGHNSGKCKKDPTQCQPPTVSELPIQYMVFGGAALIALSGGTVFFIRKRKMKSSLEV